MLPTQDRDRDAPIHHLAFDTATIPAEAGFAAWAAHSGNFRFSQGGDGPFHASASAWMLDDVIVTEQRLDPFSGVRDEALIRATPATHLSLVLVFDGEVRLVTPAMEAACRPGGILSLDYARAFVTRSTRHHGATVSFRRAFLEEAVGPSMFHGLMPATAETALLHRFVRELLARLPDARRESASLFARVLRDLVAAAVRGAGTTGGQTMAFARIRQRAAAHIAAQPPGSLDLDALPAALGVTRSTLFRVFRPDGGVLAFDRRRRLALVHSCLCDFAESRSIAEIGAVFGFVDPAYLARLFRRRYGYAMTEVRRHVAPAAVAGPPAESGAVRYRDAMLSLS